MKNITIKTKIIAFAFAILKLYSLYDDFRFIIDKKNDDIIILIIFYACLFTEPVYVVYSVLRMDF